MCRLKFSELRKEKDYEIEDSWDEILAACADGTYKQKYKIGNYKPLDMGTEGIINMQIAGKDVDALADGSGMAPLSWIGIELLKTSKRMNPSANTEYAYLDAPSWAITENNANQWATQTSYSVCELKKPYGIWQFTDRLYIDGVQLDCNWAYKDYPALTKGGGKVSGKSRVLATQENKITNPFGNGHSGVDLGWQTTQTDGILAHSPGQVVFCQTGQQNNKGSSGNASYGNCVKIKHPGGYATLYAHLSAVSVSTGQQVEKGQQIGRMGNTGNSYGNHLHFEVRNQNDVCIDPAPFIAADLPGLITEKEEADMTEDRMREIAWEEAARQNPTYNTLEDVPDYWREDIAQLVEDGIIKGTGDGKLGLTKSEVKAAVIIKRAMEKA